jgi:hypothetical protein
VRGLPIPNVSDSLSLYTPKLPVCLEKDQGIFADSYYGLSKGLHAAQRGDAEDERFSNEGLTCSHVNSRNHFQFCVFFEFLLIFPVYK